jgi:hypothetical protein
MDNKAIASILYETADFSRLTARIRSHPFVSMPRLPSKRCRNRSGDDSGPKQILAVRNRQGMSLNLQQLLGEGHLECTPSF